MEFEQLRDIDSFSCWSGIREIEVQPDIPFVGQDLKKLLGVVRFRQGKASGERCYVFGKNARQYILRTLPIENYDEICRISEYNYNLAQSIGAPCSLPVEVGACNNETLVYSVYSFPDGAPADELAKELSTTEQYELGIKAGKLLHKIHLVTPPPGEVRGDFDKALKEGLLSLAQKATDDLFDGAVTAAEYIEKTLPIVSERPQVALHGGFCLQNLYVDKEGQIGLLPLERAGWGDPVSDFAPITDNFSYPFMRGQLKGYYPDAVPSDFFSLMSLYTAAYAIFTALGAKDGSLNERSYGKWRAERAAKDFENFRCKLPVWY